MMSRRVAGVKLIQAVISRPVRPQPKQYPVFKSMEQTRLHGDSILAMIEYIDIKFTIAIRQQVQIQLIWQSQIIVVLHQLYLRYGHQFYHSKVW